MVTIDQVREFWDRRPCNIRHSQLPLGSREYFDEVENKKFRAEPHIPDFCQFDRWRGAKVLEIGCGIGTMAINFARAGAHYTGVELSGESLQLSQKRFDVYGFTGSFYHGNAEHLTDFLPVEKYDLVFSWGVIHHSPHPSHIMDQARAYMTTGTTLKLMVYATNSWKNFMIEAGLSQPEAQRGCPIANTYTPDELIHMIGPGFNDIKIQQDHIFPYQIDPYQKGEFILEPWFQPMPDPMFRMLEQKLGWHLMLTGVMS